MLRQGWGYDDSQDLRRIRTRLNAGGQLDADEHEAWSRNRRLLPDEPDGVGAGDWLLLPNIPRDGLWSIATAGGDYDFRIGETGDHGHRRAIDLLAEGIDPRGADMPASLRRTTRCQRAMWNLDAHRPALQRLCAKQSPRASVAAALESIISATRDAASLELARHFSGAELEAPIAALLGSHYRKVERRAGPTELGADLICESRDALGVPSRIAVQVKMWTGVASSTAPIDQLGRAFHALPGITGGVVMTTAESCTAGFLHAAASLEHESGIPVRVLTRDAVLDLLLSRPLEATHQPEAIHQEIS